MLPVQKSHELVSIQFQSKGRDGKIYSDGIYNYPVYEAYRDRSGVFSGLIAFTHEDMRLRTKGQVNNIKGLAVTGNFFSMLGVNPALGRLFTEEQEPDSVAHPVTVISYRFWQQHFAGEPNVIGEQLVLNARSLTVIGVTPPGFNGTIVGWIPDVYIPAGTQASMWNMDIYRPGTTWLYFLGRLKSGMSRMEAQASLSVLTDQLKESGHNVHGNIVVVDGSRGWIDWNAQSFHHPLTLFMVVAIFILIIMSVNIANMQLSRGAKRQKEIAVRQALGAGRWLVIRQLLVESLILAFSGGLFGIILANWLDRILCVLMSRIGSVSMIPGLDMRIYFFALAVSLFVGLTFGLVPALQMVHRKVIIPALKESSGFVGNPSNRWNPYHLMAIIQVTMAVAVLVCGGLFIRNLIALNRIDPGYDTKKLLAVSLEDGWRLFDRPDLRQTFEDLKERVKNLPGVGATCLANVAPLSEIGSMRGVTHINDIEIPENERTSWWYGVVSPKYFETMNMPLLSGRNFSERDTLHTEKVMVINDIMARTYWPGENPVGKSVTFRGRRREDHLNVTVIGIVRASKMRSLIEGERPIAYWPLSQDTRVTPILLIRTTHKPQPLIPVIREVVTAQGFNRVCHISTISDRVAELLYPQRAFTSILNTFGIAGLILCVTGLYSIIAFAVRQRTREIGIRMALGAEGRHVVRTILGKGAVVTAIGLGLGLGISLIAVCVLSSQLTSLQRWNKFILYGVDLLDPLTFIAVPLFVFVISLLASYIPARRAAKVDPIEALRYE
jgi:predicted permease